MEAASITNARGAHHVGGWAITSHNSGPALAPHQPASSSSHSALLHATVHAQPLFQQQHASSAAHSNGKSRSEAKRERKRRKAAAKQAGAGAGRQAGMWQLQADDGIEEVVESERDENYPLVAAGAPSASSSADVINLVSPSPVRAWAGGPGARAGHKRPREQALAEVPPAQMNRPGFVPYSSSRAVYRSLSESTSATGAGSTCTGLGAGAGGSLSTSMSRHSSSGSSGSVSTGSCRQADSNLAEDLLLPGLLACMHVDGTTHGRIYWPDRIRTLLQEENVAKLARDADNLTPLHALQSAEVFRQCRAGVFPTVYLDTQAWSQRTSIACCPPDIQEELQQHVQHCWEERHRNVEWLIRAFFWLNDHRKRSHRSASGNTGGQGTLFGLRPETLFTAVNLFDRSICAHIVSKAGPCADVDEMTACAHTTYAAAALWLASKMEESYQSELLLEGDIMRALRRPGEVYEEEDFYSLKAAVVHAETRILANVQFCCSSPTLYTHLLPLTCALGWSEHTTYPWALSIYFSLQGVLSPDFVRLPPAVQAESVVGATLLRLRKETLSLLHPSAAAQHTSMVVVPSRLTQGATGTYAAGANTSAAWSTPCLAQASSSSSSLLTARQGVPDSSTDSLWGLGMGLGMGSQPATVYMDRGQAGAAAAQKLAAQNNVYSTTGLPPPGRRLSFSSKDPTAPAYMPSSCSSSGSSASLALGFTTGSSASQGMYSPETAVTTTTRLSCGRELPGSWPSALLSMLPDAATWSLFHHGPEAWAHATAQLLRGLHRDEVAYSAVQECVLRDAKRAKVVGKGSGLHHNRGSVSDAEGEDGSTPSVVTSPAYMAFRAILRPTDVLDLLPVALGPHGLLWGEEDEASCTSSSSSSRAESGCRSGAAWAGGWTELQSVLAGVQPNG